MPLAVAFFVTRLGVDVENGAGFALNGAMQTMARTTGLKPWAILFAAVVLRAIIPLGYMPGNVLAGEFMVLCPAGLPSTALPGGAHEHHDDAGAMLDADQACPIGAALKQAALPPDLRVNVARAARPAPTALQPSSSIRSRVAARYQPRAPPTLLS